MNPNQDQLMSALRWALTTLGSFLVTNGTVSSSAWQQISGVVIALAPFVWSMFVHTPASTAMSAAAIPGVNVQVTPAAEPALQKLAIDPKVKGIEEAPPVKYLASDPKVRIEEAPPVEYQSGIYGTSRKKS